MKFFQHFCVYLRYCVLCSAAYYPNINMCWVSVVVFMEDTNI
jgi:hypothetical protein